MKQILGAKMQTRYSYPTLGLIAASVFLFSAVWSDAYAQSTPKDIYSFTGTAGTPPGGAANPEAGFVPGFLQGKDGNLYGTSFAGGANNFGTVFQVTTAGAEKIIYSFTGGGDGAFPVALVQGTDGSFYGTTTQTSATGVGTVFKLTASGTLTTLQSFAATDAGIPEGLVIGADGNLYGTSAGGSANAGTIFEIALPAGTYSTLYTFRLTDGATTPTADPDGLAPNVLIQGADGNLYGTTTGSTSSNSGEVFELTLPSEGSPVFSVVYNFGNNPNPKVADGTTPTGLIQGKDGNLYGTTVFGGANGLGTVYSLSLPATSTEAPTYLHNFPDPTAAAWDGTQPGLLVQGADGNFYVATQPLSIADGGAAGTTYGTILQVTTTTSEVTADTNFTTVATFIPVVSTQNFESPQGLIQATDGNFYGTTLNGGANSLGSVYQVAVAATGTSVGGSGDSGGSGGGAFAPLVSLPLLLVGLLRRRVRKGATQQA